MQKRKFGHSGLEVAPLAFGGNVFGWTAVEGNSGGGSETIIGKWLKRSGKRAKVVIATKVGKEVGPGSGGLSKAYIMKAVEDSLRRLQTDTIDLYQSHADDPQTPLDETAEAYDRLIQQGKVRAIGASNFNARRLAAALAVSEKNGYPRYESLQPLYNLYDRNDFEKELQPLCREKELGVIGYFSLASGFLTGKYRSKENLSISARGSFVEKYLNPRGFRIVEALKSAAQQRNLTPAQVALAWLIAQPTITAPIASATNLDQLNELIEAATIKLDTAVIDLLNQASTQNLS